MANDESKCVPQKWFALNFLQKSSFFALSSCLCWCIEALSDFLRLHQIIQFSFCVPNSASSSSFLWVDRNLLTYANRELFTLPEKSNNLPQWNFSPTPVFGCVYSLTHLQRFVCLECLCNWLNISTLLSSFDSQSKQGAKLAHTIQRWWMFLHVWLKRIRARDKTKNGVIDHDTNLIAKNLVVEWRVVQQTRELWNWTCF
jgi:hypothetical protein